MIGGEAASPDQLLGFPSHHIWDLPPPPPLNSHHENTLTKPSRLLQWQRESNVVSIFINITYAVLQVLCEHTWKLIRYLASSRVKKNIIFSNITYKLSKIHFQYKDISYIGFFKLIHLWSSRKILTFIIKIFTIPTICFIILNFTVEENISVFTTVLTLPGTGKLKLAKSEINTQRNKTNTIISLSEHKYL